MNRVVADFKAAATGDQTVRLKDFAAKKSSSISTRKTARPDAPPRGQDFRDLHAKFKRANAVIFGVSRDSLASHEKFKAKHSFPFELISDPDETLCQKFDVIKEKSLYGKKFMGIERSTFVIDAEGKLRAEWRKVKVKGHAEEVLTAVKNG